MSRIKRIAITLIVSILAFSNSFAEEIPTRLDVPSEAVVVREILNYNYVLNETKNDNPLKQFDIIIKLSLKGANNTSIKKIFGFGKKEILATIIRSGETIVVPIRPKDLVDIKVSDIFSYVATITAIKDDNSFVGLSHKASLGGTIITDDLVFDSTIYSIDSLKAEKIKDSDIYGLSPIFLGKPIGEVVKYTDYGIKGKIDIQGCSFYDMDIAHPKVGQAHIYCKSPITNKFKFYDIDITDVEDDISYIQVKDNELLENYGGLVKGMSGSAIIQDGKLVGGARSILNGKADTCRITNIKTMLKD